MSGRQLAKAVRRRRRRIAVEAGDLEAVAIAHYASAHLVRRGTDVTLCGRPARRPRPADSRWDKPCWSCAEAAKSLLA